MKPKKLKPSPSADADRAAAVFRDGLLANVDSSPTEQATLRALVDEMNQALAERYARRAQLFNEWLAFPNVTLEQAAALLLELDPWSLPPAGDTSGDSPDGRRLRRLLNRLECEVATRRLKPVGKFVHGFVRRFRLVDIARVARDENLAVSAAEQILGMTKVGGRPDEQSASPYQRERLNRRYEIHRESVALLDADPTVTVTALEPASRTKNRRKTQVESIDKLLSITTGRYNDLFRDVYHRELGGDPDYALTDEMLRSDRRELRIQLKGGRPKGSPFSPGK